MKNIIYGVLAGIMGGIVGGGFFGMLVGLVEQFDSPYDDPTLSSVMLASVGYFLFGAFFGAPFGLVCGAIFGFVPPHLFSPQQVPKVGTVFGGIVGAGISFGLMNGPIEVWASMLLFLLATLGGAGGGRIGGWVYFRLVST